MPYLRLKNLGDGSVVEFERPEVRVGRDPSSELVVGGAGSHVVSANHARFRHDGTRWVVEDVGSRNGTFVNGRRLVPGGSEPVVKGMEVGLGESGPRFHVDAVAKRVIAETVVERPRHVRPSAATMPMSALGEATQPMEGVGVSAPTPLSPPPPPPPPPKAPPPTAAPARAQAPKPPSGREPSTSPPPPAPLEVVLRNALTGDTFAAAGARIRIGRGQDCELRPVGPGDTSVSRVHTEIVLREDDSKVVVRDAGSRNGTIVNGILLKGDYELRKGDRIQLGDAGPELVLERVVVAGVDAAQPTKPKAVPEGDKAALGRTPRRSYGGKGKTVFFREMFEETERKSTKRVRVIVWSFVGLVVLVAGGMYWYSEWRTRRAVAQMQAEQAAAISAQQRVADSIRQAAQADLDRLRDELNAARASSAPAAVVESLRLALDDANRRTTDLEAALQRAQSELRQQLAAGDSIRRQAQAELQRLQQQLASAQAGGTSQQLLDSLRSAIAAAQQRQQEIEGRLRAVRGVDLAAISQANQAAVGLVTAYFSDGVADASGFVITPSGFFVTNKHAVFADGKIADSVFVTMADQNVMRRADVLAFPPGRDPDLAVLKVRGYGGAHITRIDWTGRNVRQGEPAALIGFPEGMALALDQATRTVRTSMSGGIFSKVVSDGVQFDGFTVGGSSGSPIFNANGEVVAVHRAGLRAGPGLSLAVPIRMLTPLLPAEAKAELRLPG